MCRAETVETVPKEKIDVSFFTRLKSDVNEKLS